jgi:phage terminase small subunit
MAKDKDKRRPLTYMQKKFIDELLLDPTRNATAAAKRAGYTIKNARHLGWQLTKHPVISEILEEENKKIAAKLGITKERVFQELAQIGFANLKHIMTQDENGNTDVNLAYLPDAVASPITEVSVSSSDNKGIKVKNVKVKIADKRQALIDIAKIMGWFQEKVEVTQNMSLEQLIEKSYSEEISPA